MNVLKPIDNSKSKTKNLKLFSAEGCNKLVRVCSCVSVAKNSLKIEDQLMETYTVIRRGESIQHCLSIPTEFVDQELEITIRPAKMAGDLKKRLMLLFEKNKDINPFESIDDPVAWQKEQRSEPR